ncbi:MAG TPA: N-formylglutamate amidohydrolase [Rhizobium sp.]|nr:N-formylglutamate amidohydrolase [Rhizobium sp.]
MNEGICNGMKIVNKSSFDAFEILNANGQFPCLLVCDHATSDLPARYDNLSLPDAVLREHIALDIGIEPVVRKLSSLLDAPAILTRYSRLLIDTNRWIEDPQSIPLTSDGTSIPGNGNLTAEERLLRQEHYFWPFHSAVHAAVQRLKAQHSSAYFLALHSCSRQMKTGGYRPMDGGTIWHERSDFAHRLIAELTAESSFSISDNAPYSGIGGTAFTIDYHTWGTGLAACGLEIVNDGLKTSADRATWVHLLAESIGRLVSKPTPQPIWMSRPPQSDQSLDVEPTKGF